jgi:hypothetical protein
VADAALVFRPQRNKVGALELAATLSEGHGRAVDVTEFPREAGGEAADHVKQKGATLRMEAVVTDQVTAGGQREPIRPEDAWFQLEELLTSGEPITIVTSLRQYDSMVMTALDASREPTMGAALRFTAQFRSTIIVSTETVLVRQPSQRNGQDHHKENKKAGTPADAGVSKKTHLKQLSDKVDQGLAALQKWGEH